MNHELQILLAEDHENDVTLLRQAFVRAAVKCTMRSVPDGAEALAYLGGSGSYSDRTTFPFPQLLLLDVNLPRLDGFEVLQRLRSDESLKPLIVHLFTSSSRSSDIERAYRLGANSYVVKPGSMDGLVAFARALQEWHRFVSEAKLGPSPETFPKLE